MIALGPLALAFMVGSISAASSLVTSKSKSGYARHFFLLWDVQRLWAVYVYSGLYGFLSGLGMLTYAGLVAQGVLTLHGLGAENPWLLAVYLGVSARALLHIRLFEIRTGPGEDDKYPIGIETITRILEMSLLVQVDQGFQRASRVYVAKRIPTHGHLEEVREKILKDARVLLFHDSDYYQAFKHDLDDALGSDEKPPHNDFVWIEIAMIVYLERFGKENFQALFPLVDVRHDQRQKQ